MMVPHGESRHSSYIRPLRCQYPVRDNLHYPQSDILHSGRVSQNLQCPARNQTLIVKRVLKHSILQKPGQNATRLQVSHKRPSVLKKETGSWVPRNRRRRLLTSATVTRRSPTLTGGLGGQSPQLRSGTGAVPSPTD